MRWDVMKKILLIGTIFFLLFLTPRVGMAQTFVGSGPANPLGGASPGLVNGGFHFHINPADDHYAFESLDRHTYQYEALHGYEHIKSEKLQQVERFKDIQSPKDQPATRSSYDSFFGVESDNPLKW
jgi:hypothetical protein